MYGSILIQQLIYKDSNNCPSPRANISGFMLGLSESIIKARCLSLC